MRNRKHNWAKRYASESGTRGGHSATRDYGGGLRGLTHVKDLLGDRAILLAGEGQEVADRPDVLGIASNRLVRSVVSMHLRAPEGLADIPAVLQREEDLL